MIEQFCLTDETLRSTPGQSEPGSNGSKEVTPLFQEFSLMP